MTLTAHTVPENSIEAKALRCEREAVISAFGELTAALMERMGWNKVATMLAMQVMQRVILAYELGVELRESRVCSRLVGKKLTIPPEVLRVLCALCREVYELTRDPRAAAMVDQAFLIGWERNKRSSGGAPKKTAGATVMELMKRTEKTENDKRERWRMRKRLEKMIEEFRARN